MKQEEPTDLPYKLHCCEIVMAEIRNELAAQQELQAIRTLLRADLEEIKSKTIPAQMFLVHKYW